MPSIAGFLGWHLARQLATSLGKVLQRRYAELCNGQQHDASSCRTCSLLQSAVKVVSARVCKATPCSKQHTLSEQTQGWTSSYAQVSDQCGSEAAVLRSRPA